MALFKKKQISLMERRNNYGYLFVSHWILGLLLFFIFPMISSVVYSFCNLSMTNDGLHLEFTAFEHFRYIFNDDPKFVDNLLASVTSLLTALPIIISLSMILAVILNSEFKGRLIFRAIFFLPVILANSTVMQLLASEYLDVPLFNVSSGSSGEYGSMIDFEAILLELQLPQAISDLFQGYLSNLFDLIWSCGVQTILFLAGLQSIPKQLYEVGTIEGCSRWETFWFLEIPSLRNIIQLVLIYTMIDQFTALSSPVMQQATDLMFKQTIYDRSSAILWTYFLIVGVVMAILLVLYNRLCVRRWE